MSNSPSQGSQQTSRSNSVLDLPATTPDTDCEVSEKLRFPGKTPQPEPRMSESWSPKANTMMALVPPDPDFVHLKRRLRRSRENIRQSRHDFFSSPPSSRTPTPSEMWLRCRKRNTDTLWEHQAQPTDRLSVPSICVTNNSGSPMSISDREDDLDEESTSSLSMRYFSEDEGVELRRPSDQVAYPAPVSRSQSFQDQSHFPTDSPDQLAVKRVLSDDVIGPLNSHRHTSPGHNCLPQKGLGKSANSRHQRPHVMSRLIDRMRRVTLDWRRDLKKHRRGS